MNTLLHQVDQWLPFGKTERIILAIVLLVHALFFVSLQMGLQPKTESNLDESRVMANLVSPEAAKAPPAAQTPPQPKLEPRPKTEQKPEQPKKVVDEKSNQAPTPPAPSPPQSKSESSLPNATVAPSNSSGPAGTPIQTDIGKLVVVYQPDADAYYPSFSKRSGEQGEVVVRLIINETGEVEDVALLRSSSFPRLDRAASEIGRRYRFKPFLVNGIPNRISTNLLIKFNLKN